LQTPTDNENNNRIMLFHLTTKNKLFTDEILFCRCGSVCFGTIERTASGKMGRIISTRFSRSSWESRKGLCDPLGIIEKHGPALPLGTDLMIVRDVVLKAAQEEYVVVFPEFFVGQINEARHQPEQ
jgi:hypothetical protein